MPVWLFFPCEFIVKMSTEKTHIQAPRFNHTQQDLMETWRNNKKTYSEIALLLGVDVNQVEKHFSQLCQKKRTAQFLPPKEIIQNFIISGEVEQWLK